MQAVQMLSGQAVPLNRNDVDTDQIIPSDWLKQVERTGFGRALFSEWRDDPNFILNNEAYQGAAILIAGKNFGVGSSREHAVWAIQQYGFQAVISPQFGDIFKNNATKNGLLPIELSEESTKTLIEKVEENPGIEFTISVDRLLVEAPEIDFCELFHLTPTIQERFLQGLDDISLTLKKEESITAHENQRHPWLPATI